MIHTLRALSWSVDNAHRWMVAVGGGDIGDALYVAFDERHLDDNYLDGVASAAAAALFSTM